MKHIDITEPTQDGLAEFMVTQESNNFGDQILTLKKLFKVWDGDYKGTVTMYKPIAFTSRGEGDWMTRQDMTNWLNNLKGV